MSKYSIRYALVSGRWTMKREEQCASLVDAMERAERVARLEGCEVKIVHRDRKGRRMVAAVV